jgi:hypothetical protein
MAELAEARKASHIRSGRQRSCIVTREVAASEELIRFVRAPDGAVVPDLDNKLPGRGVWVGASRATLDTAVRKRLFARGFKADATADPDLPERVDRLLADRVLGLLGLARKASAMITGFDKVDKAARSRPLAVVFHAADGAEDGLRKIWAALLAGGQKDSALLVRAFTSEELSLALGLANVIHAAVPAGPMGRAVAERVVRLARYRGEDCAKSLANSLDRHGQSDE